MTALAHGNDTPGAIDSLLDLSAMAALPWGLTWESTLVLVAASAYLLAKAACIASVAVQNCVQAKRLWRRK